MDYESFELIIVGLGEWIRPEVGDELLHAPLAHAVSRSDGGRAYACDEERAHAVSASTPTLTRVNPFFSTKSQVVAQGATPRQDGENLCRSQPASDRLVRGNYCPDQPRARTGDTPPPD